MRIKYSAVALGGLLATAIAYGAAAAPPAGAVMMASPAVENVNYRHYPGHHYYRHNHWWGHRYWRYHRWHYY